MPRDIKDEEKRNMSEKESEKTRKRRRPRKRTTRSTEEKWEAVRKGAWLRELLSSSSEDEEGAEEKRAKVEEKYMRFEESRRWIKEMLTLIKNARPKWGPRPLRREERRAKSKERIASNSSPRTRCWGSSTYSKGEWRR